VVRSRVAASFGGDRDQSGLPDLSHILGHTSSQVFITTAISQNGVLDGFFVLTCCDGLKAGANKTSAIVKTLFKK